MTDWHANEAAQRGSILRHIPVGPSDADGGMWETAVANSGASALTHRGWSVGSGATASSTALARVQQESGFSQGARYDVIDFDQRFVLHTRIVAAGGTNLGVSRITLGKAHGDGIGNLANKGFGWHIANLSLASIVHNGTDFALSGTGDTLTLAIIYNLRIESLGDGTVHFYLNNALVSTETGGPTGLGTVDDSCFQVEVSNGADAANQQVSFWDVMFEDVG